MRDQQPRGGCNVSNGATILYPVYSFFILIPSDTDPYGPVAVRPRRIGRGPTRTDATRGVQLSTLTDDAVTHRPTLDRPSPPTI